MKTLIALLLTIAVTGCASAPKPTPVTTWHWDSRQYVQRPQDTPYLEVRINSSGELVYRLPVFIPKEEI